MARQGIREVSCFLNSFANSVTLSLLLSSNLAKIGRLALGVSSHNLKEALERIERRDVMNEKIDSVVSVVVLEPKAEFPKWVAEYQRHATNSVVVAYAPGETLGEFEARVRRRLSEVTGEVRVAIVACASSVEEPLLAARQRVGRTLLDAMSRSKSKSGGELLLAASVDADEACKHSIFDLAGLLCDGLGGTNCAVRVRFSSGRPESGIMSSISLPEVDHPAYQAVLASRG